MSVQQARFAEWTSDGTVNFGWLGGWDGRWRGYGGGVCVGFRYPAEIISQAVWVYRFALSFRDVSELMLARGVVVSHETIRQWTRKFGQDYANGLRHGWPRPGDKWHLDEVVIKMNIVQHYLLRAAGQDGVVLDVLVQRRRNLSRLRLEAAKKFFRKLLKGLRYTPRVLVTDKLGSYSVAHRETLSSAEHRRSKYLNNRAPSADPSAGAGDEALPLRGTGPTVLLGARGDPLLALPTGPASDVRLRVASGDDRNDSRRGTKSPVSPPPPD